jgi:hypothetical protein
MVAAALQQVSVASGRTRPTICAVLLSFVVWDPDAVVDFESLKGKEERKALFNVVEKLRQLGPRLVPPHVKSLKDEPGLFELRPKQGASAARPIFRQTADGYAILAVAVKADKADFAAAVSAARARYSRYDA